MRICLVSAALPDIACGIGDYTNLLAGALVAEGVGPVVLTASRPGLRTDLPYEVRTFPTHWRLGETPSIARAALKTRPDIVHVEFPGSGYGRGFGVTALPWAVLVRQPKLPTAITFHEFDKLSPQYRARLAAGSLPCRLVVTVGGGVTRSVRHYLGWRPGLHLVEIPIASPLAPPSIGPVAQSSDHAAFRRTPDELVLGYWGFLRPDKGLETLVEAFARIRQARAARLVLAGDAGPDESYVRRVHARLAEAGLDGDTLSTGPLAAEALSEALLGFDVCVFPFRDGLTPNRGSYSAAVAHGIKIVTTRAAGPGFDAATNTWFVSPGDPDGLAWAIVDAAASPIRGVARDPSADWAEIARRHVEAYRSVLRR